MQPPEMLRHPQIFSGYVPEVRVRMVKAVYKNIRQMLVSPLSGTQYEAGEKPSIKLLNMRQLYRHWQCVFL